MAEIERESERESGIDIRLRRRERGERGVEGLRSERKKEMMSERYKRLTGR